MSLFNLFRLSERSDHFVGNNPRRVFSEDMNKAKFVEALLRGSPKRRYTMPNGANKMRSLLALGLLMTLCASASAAMVHHPRNHVIARFGEGFLRYAIPRSAYAAVGPAVRYDSAPSYNDPSKYGGGTALPVD